MMCLCKLWRLTIGKKENWAFFIFIHYTNYFGKTLTICSWKAPLKFLPFFQYKNALDMILDIID
jgi:hypothetical protein